MKRALFLAAAVASTATPAQKEAGMILFDFDSDTPGEPPKQFQFGMTGKGRPGMWIVQAVDHAPSGKNVLAQTDGDTTDYRFPTAYTASSTT